MALEEWMTRGTMAAALDLLEAAALGLLEAAALDLLEAAAQDVVVVAVILLDGTQLIPYMIASRSFHRTGTYRQGLSRKVSVKIDMAELCAEHERFLVGSLIFTMRSLPTPGSRY